MVAHRGGHALAAAQPSRHELIRVGAVGLCAAGADGLTSIAAALQQCLVGLGLGGVDVTQFTGAGRHRRLIRNDVSAAVTIVIPIWDDHVALLPRCLKSIAHQEVPSEILIVDNASRTPINAPSGGRLISLSARQTVGAARNAGLEEVTTPFVVFADADDELADGALARGVRLLDQRAAASGVIGRSLVDEYGERLRRGRTPSKRFLACSRFLPRLAPLFWLANFQASITSTVLRTSAVKAAGGFADADIGEDWLLAARLARRGPLICLTEPVRIYHRHRAAMRNTSSRPGPAALRRAVCKNCIGDPSSTRSQRLVADFLLRCDGARSPAD